MSPLRIVARYVLVALSCLAADVASAQVASGTVRGEVRDQAGQPVPAAVVMLAHVGTNRERTVVTDDDGVYTAPGLAPGEYRLAVSSGGFRPMERTGVRVATGETLRLDLELTLGGVTEAITVHADAPLLRSDTASLGQVLTGEKIVGLPLNGRSFISLAALAPGVALPPGSSLPRINGGRPRTNEYLFDGINDHNQFDLRIDHRGSGNRDQLFARLSHFRERFLPVTPLPDGSGVTAGTLGPQQTRAWAFASSYQRSFSSALLNELRAGDTRRRVARSAAQIPGGPRSGLNLPGIPSNAAFAETLPTFLVTGYQQLGSPASTAIDFDTGVTQVADTVTWLAGRHTVRAGADIRWARLNVLQPPSPTGTFQFSALFTDLPGVANTGTPLASFLLGQVQTFSIDLQQDEIRNRAHVQEYFVQDDWRLSTRATLNAGVRYTLNFPSVEQRNQAAVFDLDRRRLDYLGRDGNPRAARQLHKLNFGPRLGLVGQLDERTVARAGYGLVWIAQAGITTPFTTPVFPFLQTVSQRTLDNVSPAFVLEEGPRVAPLALTPEAGIGQGVFSVDRDLGSGYVQQWNMSVQRQIGANVSLEAAYVGSTITRVGIPDTNLNQLSVDQLALGPELLRRVPNPYFGMIPRSSSLGDPTITVAQLMKPYPEYTTVSLYRNNVGTTLYHGFEAKIEQRLSRGLSYLVSYTRSRLLDDASSVFDASILTGPVANYPVADSFNRRLERDYSAGDMPHVLAGSFVWSVKRWTFAGVMTLQSGVPIAVTQATNFNAFAGFGTQRPDVVANPTLPARERTVQRWFDVGAFSPAPQFALGTSSRHPVRGPAYRNLDVAVMRDVTIRGRAALQFRAEAFNLTNTPPLGPPNGVFGTPAFGTITTAGDPRVLQVAVKLQF